MIFSVEGSKAVSNLYAMFSCARKGDVAGVLCVLRVSQDCSYPGKLDLVLRLGF